MVNFELLKSGLRYLSEIFSICSSHVCANLMKKFLPLLNQPACNGPFLPKFWTALATVIVGIFFWKKFWWGFRPISVAYQKEFWISWKKRRFQIFQKPISPGFQSFLFACIRRRRENLNQCKFGPVYKCDFILRYGILILILSNKIQNLVKYVVNFWDHWF